MDGELNLSFFILTLSIDELVCFTVSQTAEGCLDEMAEAPHC